jgi:hypothetical protein
LNPRAVVGLGNSIMTISRTDPFTGNQLMGWAYSSLLLGFKCRLRSKWVHDLTAGQRGLATALPAQAETFQGHLASVEDDITGLRVVPMVGLLTPPALALCHFLLLLAAHDLEANVQADGFGLLLAFQDQVQHREALLQAERFRGFCAGFRLQTAVWFLHAFGVFVFGFIPRELVGSAANPPTAFSTTPEKFPSRF